MFFFYRNQSGFISNSNKVGEYFTKFQVKRLALMCTKLKQLLKSIWMLLEQLIYVPYWVMKCNVFRTVFLRIPLQHSKMTFQPLCIANYVASSSHRKRTRSLYDVSVEITTEKCAVISIQNLMDWIGLHLFNDDTCPPGHINRPSQIRAISFDGVGWPCHQHIEAWTK